MIYLKAVSRMNVNVAEKKTEIEIICNDNKQVVF